MSVATYLVTIYAIILYRSGSQKRHQSMKSGKAPGVDSIHAEMLKADLSTATSVLTDSFETISDKETIPSD